VRPVEAVFIGYRRGPKTQNPREVLIRVRGNPGALIGRKVYWVDPKGRRSVGVIVAKHGCGDVWRARFKRPPPPQLIGSMLQIA